MSVPHLGHGQELPPGIEPWCTTLRGEQAWRLEVPGGKAALDTWMSLRDRHDRTGLWPVLLGPDASVVDQLTWRVSILAEDRPGIPLIDETPPAPELFVQWMGDPAEEYQVGDVVEFPTPGGEGRYAGVVREVGGGWLLFDFNHPLAGQPVRFEVQLIGVL